MHSQQAGKILTVVHTKAYAKYILLLLLLLLLFLAVVVVVVKNSSLYIVGGLAFAVTLLLLLSSPKQTNEYAGQSSSLGLALARGDRVGVSRCGYR